MKQYKAVAGPKNINVGKGDTQSAFNTFAEIINSEATGGWEATSCSYKLLHANCRKGYVI